MNVEDLNKKSIRDEVASILSRMPTHLARMLHLHFIEDKSQADIAEEEDMSVSAVKTRVHRAKKEFKKINVTIGA